ncbi:MAG: hypothetical protein LBU25_10920, partial [Treponema sp.]|nr:hypothetical protein [Treponema sp.]
MKRFKALLAASLAVPDEDTGVQGTNFKFYYKDSSGNLAPVPGASVSNLGSTLDWLSTNKGGSYGSYVIQLDTSETLNGKKSLSYGAKTVSVEIRGYAAVSIKGGS